MNLRIFAHKLLNLPLNIKLIRSIRIKAEPHTEYEMKTNPNLIYRGFQQKERKESDWLKYNSVIYSPKLNGEPRPAEITGESLTNPIRYKSLYPLIKMITGLSIEEALKQLNFKSTKAARAVEKLLNEMVNKSVEEQSVEFPTDLWIENAHVVRGMGIKRLRHGVRRVITGNTYHYNDFRIRLREGKPPNVYHENNVFSGYETMDHELERLRRRRIIYGL